MERRARKKESNPHSFFNHLKITRVLKSNFDMSEHLSYMKRVSRKPIRIIQSELAKSINRLNPHVETIRVKSLENGSVKRVYVKAKDTGVLGTVGWVVNDNIAKCMLCKNQFGFFTRKHHCRACGNLVCYQCSGNSSLIVGAEQLGQQRICNECCSKQSAKLAVPVPVYGSMDWGKPFSGSETESEDDDHTEASNEQIKSVDVRTISQANDHHNSKQHPALIGAILTEETKSNSSNHGPSTASPAVKSASVALTAAPARGVNVGAFGGSMQYVTIDMMTFEYELLASKKDVRTLKGLAADHPKMLLGWQITLDVNVKPESIHIVLDLRKNALTRKTEFLLAQVKDDLTVLLQWSLLKRGPTKSGVEFVPMRKVLFTGEDDLSAEIVQKNATGK